MGEFSLEIVILYWGFSGDSSWCSIGEKSLCLSSLCYQTCYTKYEMIGVVIVSVVLIVKITVLILEIWNDAGDSYTKWLELR